MFALHVIERMNADEARKRTAQCRKDQLNRDVDRLVEYAHERINEAVRGGFDHVRHGVFSSYATEVSADDLDSVAVRLRAKGYTVRKVRDDLGVTW